VFGWRQIGGSVPDRAAEQLERFAVRRDGGRVARGADRVHVRNTRQVRELELC
jgi:hypothetical protein